MHWYDIVTTDDSTLERARHDVCFIYLLYKIYDGKCNKMANHFIYFYLCYI